MMHTSFIQSRHSDPILFSTRSRRLIPSVVSRATNSVVKALRLASKESSRGVGPESSTTGNAGFTILPPIFADKSDLGSDVDVMIKLLKLYDGSGALRNAILTPSANSQSDFELLCSPIQVS